MKVIILSSMLAFASGFYLSVPTQSFSWAGGYIANSNAIAASSPVCDTVNMPSGSSCVANMCADATYNPGTNYWCNNSPSTIAKVLNQQSLSFNITVPTNGNYTIGLTYSTTTVSTVSILVDGNLQPLGSFPITVSPSYVNIVTTPGSLISLPAGDHIFTLAITSGTLHAYSFIVTDTNSVAQPKGYPDNAFIIKATQYTSAFGIPQTSADIDASYSAASIVNFCKNPLDLTTDTWCYNGPSNGVQQSLTFSVTLPTTFTSTSLIYFAIKYSALSQTRVLITVNGLTSLIPIWTLQPSPSLSTFAIQATSTGFSLPKGKKIFQITILGPSSIRMVEIAFATSPITSGGFATPTTTSATVTTAGVTTVPTALQVGLNSNDSSSSSFPVGAIIGIAVGAGVILAIGITLFLRSKNSKASSAVAKEVKGEKEVKSPSRRSPRKTATPTIKKMVDQ